MLKTVSLSCTLLLAFLYALPFNAYADSEAEERKPGQLYEIKLPTDRNHNPSPDQLPSQAQKKEIFEDAKIQANGALPKLGSPLRRGLVNNDHEIIAISGYFDHDPAFSNNLKDWNCGTRSYDTEDYNHDGTDISMYQSWYSMANDRLVIVAAADGVISGRHDGEFDQRCTFDESATANSITMKHDDGSITHYWHMKKGSVTPRKVGDRVEKGDYLGVVGSSGISTGPHLHFDFTNPAGQTLDPYAGNCNPTVTESLWDQQEPYYVKRIISVETHSAPPEYPECPQQEVPHYKTVFAPADTVVVSMAVRDLQSADTVKLEIKDPFGTLVFQQSIGDPNTAHSSMQYVYWSIPAAQQLGGTGKYQLIGTYSGHVVTHDFYIGAGPEPEPVPVTNNAVTGLWYDQALDGEGYNIVTTAGNTIVYFYGNDNRGNRLWLISHAIPGEIKAGVPIEVLMYESTGGVFPTPVQSTRGLSIWGKLTIVFNGCTAGQATLNGVDGNKVSNITKLVGVSGANCTEGAVVADAPWAGLWYDPGKDGEGYNLIVTPEARILYFYGFKKDGLRLWLISRPITETLEVGKTVEIEVFEATKGTFQAPAPSNEALVSWGSAKITVVNCNTMTIVIEGTDGSKTSNTVRLAGIVGSSCPG